jgi:carboxyl-terminal processing protease
MFKNSKIKSIVVPFFSVVIFFALGVYVGFNNQASIDKIVSISNKEKPVGILTDFSPFWKVWDTIDEKYPNAKEINDQNRIYGAITGLVNSLNDPYSTFFNPEETKSFEDDISGSFGGIGVEVDIKDKILTVIAPLKDTPGYNAGLKSGDKILKINENLTSNLTIEQAIDLMRGEKGTSVTLTIFREGEEDSMEIKIIRDIINVPVLKTELRKDGVFIITLYSFSANSADLFNTAIKEFKDSKSNKLLIDLRGNPGGYLDSAVSMASWFLPSGKTVVIEDYKNNKKQKIYRSEGSNIFNDKLKFVILIDNGSASASEILAGAMQDYGLAKIVGEQSYGKGSVQEIVNITPDTILKITVAKWLTPKGTSISEKGLTPDYEVKFTKEDEINKKDPQMDKAIELLLN